VAVTVSVALFAGCGGSGSLTTGPPPAGLVASLEDQTDATGGWRTTWVLCWDADPAATAYEIRTVTGEGASPRLRRQQDHCLRIEAAAGDGPGEDRLARRAAQLTAQQGQLAFQVRAVPRHGPASDWSPAVAVGTEGPVSR
jgi:hypothetical protein